MIRSALKRLSTNDVGATKSHQAGFLIPKSLVRGGLFDPLTEKTLNPRSQLKFRDTASDLLFYPNFIYYNNKYFGGTRFEYRLTGLTKWIRESGLQEGDSIQISRTGVFAYDITTIKKVRRPRVLTEESWVALYGNGEVHA